MNPSENDDDYLNQIKARIRIEADAARQRTPLPRHDPPPRSVASVDHNDGIDRDRLDYSLAELCAPHHIAFLDLVFRAILKRPPDDAGSSTQMRLIGAGASKVEIIGNLRYSPEGLRVGTRIAGLRPRYLLSKACRVPVLGLGLEWLIAFAALPFMARHLRAADAYATALSNTAADSRQALADRLGDATRSAETQLATLSAQTGARLVELDARAADLDERTRALHARQDRPEHELALLRHEVLAIKHWVTSLQTSLDALDTEATDRSERDQQLAAKLNAHLVAADPGRAARHAAWAEALLQRTTAPTEVLDLASNNGAWPAALAARGAAVRGVEANRVLQLDAQARGIAVGYGQPAVELARLADASLGALTVASTAAVLRQQGLADLLAQAQRVLKPGGWLLLGCERHAAAELESPTRAAAPDAKLLEDVLRACGCAQVVRIDAADGTPALLAQWA